jgi:hypothetical protein
MKKVVLVSTYCDTQEKIDVLSKNIDNVKLLGLDVIVISPFVLPENVQNKCDYFFLTKDNPILDWPLKAMFVWQVLPLGNQEVRITRTQSDYGWAGLYQVKKLSEIALSYDYDYFYHIIYDLKFDETVVSGLLGEADCDVYSSKRDEDFWQVGLHFMIFNREKLNEFISHITLENYLSQGENVDAFVWLHRLMDVFPYNNVTTPVEDEIYYYSGLDLFNYSPIDGIKFFIEKDDEVNETLKLFFYDINETINIILRVGDNKFGYQINGNSLIDMGFKKDETIDVSIIYYDVEYNITEKIKKIKHNTLKLIE